MHHLASNMPHTKLPMPNAHQRLQIAAIARVDPRTVVKCYRSKPVRSTVAAAVVDAARALQLPEPQIVVATSAR